MSNTLADAMHTWYSLQLGHDGDLIELEREYFGAADDETWADAALRFYSAANGSSPVGSLADEALKYYSAIAGDQDLSGINGPPGGYTLTDYINYVFRVSSGHSPIPTANLVAHYEAGDLLGGQAFPNLLTPEQQSFESGIVGWSLYQVTGESSGEQALIGANSLKATATVAGVDCYAYMLATQSPDVVEGLTYTFVASVKAGPSTVGQLALFTLNWVNSVGASVGTLTSPSVTADNTWQTITLTGVAPAGAVKAGFAIRHRGVSTAIGNVLYWDKIGAWQGSSTEWRDSNGLPPDGYPVDLWADISAEQQNLLTVNQATIETDLTGLSAFGTGTISVVNSNPAEGSNCGKIVANGGNVSFGSVNTDPYRIPVIPGKPYTGLVSVRVNAAVDRQASVIIAWLTSTGTTAGDIAGPSSIPTTTWSQRSVTGIAPANAAYAYVFLRVTSALASQEYFIDKLSLALGYSQVWEAPDPSKTPHNLTQPTPAIRPLFRNANKNLLTYNQATIETNTDWIVAYTNCTIARVTTEKLSGSASLEIISTVDGSGVRAGPAETLSVLPPAIPGRTYTGVVSMKRAVGQGDVNFYSRIKFFDSSGTSIDAGSNETPIPMYEGSWQQQKSSAVAPANAAYVNVSAVIVNPNPALGDIFYADQFGVWEGPTTDWLPPVTLFNGEPGIQFIGPNTYMDYDPSIVIAQPYTVYAVVSLDSSGTNPFIYDTGEVDGGNRGALTSGGGLWQLFSGVALNSTASLTGYPNVVISGIVDADNSVIAVNDMETGGPAGPNSLSFIRVGNRYTQSGNSGLSGTLFTLLFYNGRHDDATVKSITDYLMTKYGIGA